MKRRLPATDISRQSANDRHWSRAAASKPAAITITHLTRELCLKMGDGGGLKAAYRGG